MKSNPPLTASFVPRHIGSSDAQVRAMLDVVGCASLEELVDQAVPAAIRTDRPLALGSPMSEDAALARLRQLAEQNRVLRSMIGMGYSGTFTPPVILRNIIENPLWYTPYTPYQAEIAQGRLEALLNFQTMVSDLTGLPLANASLLDEATAAAEAMAMCHAIGRHKRPSFFAAADCHPQIISVLRTRAEGLGIQLVIGDPQADIVDWASLSGLLVSYPNTMGTIVDFRDLFERARSEGVLCVVAADLLALTLLTPPGEFGADIAVGSSQRFGVPMGFGGPHAAYMSTLREHARRMPGRIVGVSVDAQGRQAYRLAIQTREQHIRRDKATSNICTSQALLAVVAGMYAVYHGPEGLRRIAQRVHQSACVLAAGIARLGYQLEADTFFDTVCVRSGERSDALQQLALERGFNVRRVDSERIALACDETTQPTEIATLVEVFAFVAGAESEPSAAVDSRIPAALSRAGEILTHPIFRTYHTEHELLRYITRLQSRDISLAHSMIPLGSCTMKLNAAAEMIPITWPHFAEIHPFAPVDQCRGYQQMIDELGAWLAEITGFAAVSMQPNAGSQGEFAGLTAIRRFQRARGEGHRDVCLIPVSAHGTNPASAVIAGLRVVPVACAENGDIDVDDLRKQAEAHRDSLSALMVTYPSTHGVFEASIREVCEIIHANGGQVYMDGANMNAQVGICRPAEIGADVLHLNLHKTFCIPHGGGGPGMGPIGVADHLVPYLPGHPVDGEGAVSSAPHGSAMILPISWMYIAMMGAEGLLRATQIAILNANYMATRLSERFKVLYTGPNGRVAHEFIIDGRPFERLAGVRVDDIAKRLMDFGFHAPTMSWPVAGTLMIEPTESESKEELDRFCEALLHIRSEIDAIAEGRLDREDHPLAHSPHTAAAVCSDEWTHAYPREAAAFPLPWLRESKYWPPVGRIDNAFGDRNLVCTCPSVSELAS